MGGPATTAPAPGSPSRRDAGEGVERRHAAIAPGVLVGGYRVEALIGEGGSAAVFAAQRLSDGEHVAIKVMHLDAQAHPELRERFFREAATAARMQSDHAARVLDMGTVDGGAPYIVFERLKGSDLADVLDSRDTVSVAEALTWLLQACEAVAEAHALGIVHRDLKPENLFLAELPDGAAIIKVIDFGISKIVHPTWVGRELSLTRSQVVMGSPKYMAPEQLRAAASADARSDVWSLGVVLYELLAGRAPFEATSLADLCVAVLKDAPRPLADLRADLPPGLAPLVMRCLDKSPERRFADAADLATALSQIVPHEPSHRAPPRPPRISLPPPSSFETLPPVAGTIAPPRPPWSRRFMALAALGAALIGATFAAKQPRTSHQRTELLPPAIARAADSAASGLSSEASASPADVAPEEQADEPAPTAEPEAPPQPDRAATARTTTSPPPRPPRRRPAAPGPSATPAPQPTSFKVPLWARD